MTLWILFLSTSNLLAEENKYFMGIGASYSGLSHITDKPFIFGEPFCGRFDTGNSKGWSVMAKAGYYLLPDFLYIDGRMLYDHRPIDFSGNSNCFEILDPATDQYVPFQRSHSFSGSLDYLSIDFGIGITPLKFLPISFRISADAGNPLFKSSYSVIERIVSPNGVFYPNNQPIRENESGDIDGAGTSLGASLGAMYSYNINESLSLDFEISRRFPLNSAVDNFNLKSDIFRGGIALTYRFGKKPVPEKPIEVPKEIEPEKEEVIPEPIAEITPEKLLKDFSSEEILITETIVTQTFPILPYFFFEAKSSVLPDKYKSTSNIKDFNEQDLDKETMGIYYRSLDIIGSRLQKSKATVRLVGNSDGREFDSLAARIEIARKRAVAVAEYLNKRWNIPMSRITIEARDLPTNPTSLVYQEADAENRRVEVLSNSASITAPVVHRNFFEYHTNAKAINFNLESNNAEKINIALFANGAKIASQSDTYDDLDADSNISFPLNTALINQIAKGTKSGNTKAVLEISNSSQTENYEYPLKVQLSQEQFEIGRLNLIVFDFDKALMSGANRELLKEFTLSSIKSDSEVAIIGTTDILGEESYNRALSLRRAENTKSAIESVLSGVRFTKVEGTGADEFKYSNDSPEGRFYNRTVLIEVKTKINK